MSWNAADEGVGAGFEFGRDFFFAFGNRFQTRQFFPLFQDPPVVGDRGGVVEVDRDFARLGAEIGLVEGEGGGVGGQRQSRRGLRPGAGLRVPLRALFALGHAALARALAAFLRAGGGTDGFLFFRTFGRFFGFFFALLAFAAEGAAFVGEAAGALAFFKLFVELRVLGRLGFVL